MLVCTETTTPGIGAVATSSAARRLAGIELDGLELAQLPVPAVEMDVDRVAVERDQRVGVLAVDRQPMAAAAVGLDRDLMLRPSMSSTICARAAAEPAGVDRRR